jgi:hypothetical protein
MQDNETEENKQNENTPLASELVEDLDSTTIASDKEQERIDKLIEERTAKFMELFDKMDSENIDLIGPEATAIARTATNEIGINQKVSNLGDLKVEDLTEYELRRILKRARSAIKRTIELRTKFAPIVKEVVQPDGSTNTVEVGRYGPYFKSRRDKKPLHRKRTQQPLTASGIIKDLRERKQSSMLGVDSTNRM